MRATPQYTGPIKKNFVVCDITGTPTGGAWESSAYFRLADVYGGITSTDSNNILTNVDYTNKVIAYDDLAIRTPSTDPQLFVSDDKQQIAWCDEQITTDSECYDKLEKLVGR